MSKESKHVVKFRKSHLNPDEDIIAWSEGYIGELMGKEDKKQQNGVMIITNHRAIFYRKGLLGEVIESIPIKNITSIERKSILGHRTIRLHTSNDQLEFKTFEKELELISAIEAGRDSSKIRPTEEDPVSVLKKLGELKDLGIITPNEFQKKKELLLDKI